MTAADYLPERRSLPSMREAVQECRGCSLYANATQAVFGEGPGKAEIVMVGEQPGDQEDRRGKPFIGPAGRILSQGLEEAGIDRTQVFVTNVVKHFKFERRGKRRIHKRPSAEEVRACRPWLDAELEVVKPKALVALGATAAQDLFGRSFRVTKQRGEPLDFPFAPLVMATIHPSAILRADDDQREEEYRRFVQDLESLARGVRELREAS
jgi:uracil-DNA glycosylase family protein